MSDYQSSVLACRVDHRQRFVWMSEQLAAFSGARIGTIMGNTKNVPWEHARYLMYAAEEVLDTGHAVLPDGTDCGVAISFALREDDGSGMLGHAIDGDDRTRFACCGLRRFFSIAQNTHQAAWTRDLTWDMSRRLMTAKAVVRKTGGGVAYLERWRDLAWKGTGIPLPRGGVAMLYHRMGPAPVGA